MSASILLVEDDLSLGETLEVRLGKDYQVSWASTCKAARDFFSKQPFDLVIFDVGLPDGDGFSLANEFKNQKDLQFIFLTAQADAESRLKGFELGADEFIPKPFQLKELLLRVKHVLDQHAPVKEVRLSEVVISWVDFSLKFPDGRIDYPPVTEMKLLQFLIESSPKPVSRDEIINAVWGVDKMPSHRTVDNMIVKLRQLLGDSKEKYIRSVRGVGYQWIH